MNVIAVIEWPSDAALAPSVILGSGANVRRAVVRELLKAGMEQDDFFVDAPDFLNGHPLPATWESDDDALVQWLADMREATTVPWVSFYNPATDADGPDDTEYLEVP